MAVMEAAGFVAVTVERQHLCYEQDVQVWLETVRRRDTCSQLLAISDVAYEAGGQGWMCPVRMSSASPTYSILASIWASTTCCLCG